MGGRRGSLVWVSCVIGAAVIGLAAPLQAAPAASAATACVTTRLIGVHGTGEETGVIGAELANLYNAVYPHTGIAEEGLNGWSDYNFIAALKNGGGFDINKLIAAINTGTTDLYQQVTQEASQCPAEHFVIAGFSQGAAVVGSFAEAHPELAGRVEGIVLWADPAFNGADPASQGADIGSGTWVATADWHGMLGARAPYPSAWSGRVHSYCTSIDPVCNITNLLTIVNLAHHGDERFEPILGSSVGDIYASAPSVWDVAGGPQYYSKWTQYGGVNGILGQPTDDPPPGPSEGQLQPFDGQNCGAGSAILWSPASGTHEMQGCIYAAFVHRFGGVNGAYGFPVTDELATAGGTGRVSYMTGTACGSAHGSGLFFGVTIGTWPVHGCIYQHYEQIREDHSGIGLPTSDEYPVSGGVEQNFSHGNIRDIGGVITVTINASGLALDNTDPYVTGCAGPAHPESTVATTTDGPTVINLQWSGYCGTNWAQVIPNTGDGGPSMTMDIWVERLEANGTVTTGEVFRFRPNGSVLAWSNQLYAPVLHARACENFWSVFDKQWSTPVCTGWV